MRRNHAKDSHVVILLLVLNLAGILASFEYSSMSNSRGSTIVIKQYHVEKAMDVIRSHAVLKIKLDTANNKRNKSAGYWADRMG
jgi:hypothetical protein